MRIERTSIAGAASEKAATSEGTGEHWNWLNKGLHGDDGAAGDVEAGCAAQGG